MSFLASRARTSQPRWKSRLSACNIVHIAFYLVEMVFASALLFVLQYFALQHFLEPMAWRCHGSTNSEMVDALVHAQLISSSVVEAAFHVIDRLWFFPPRTPATVAYQDSPQPIGYGATISAPHMHAMMAELMAGRGGAGGVLGARRWQRERLSDDGSWTHGRRVR